VWQGCAPLFFLIVPILDFGFWILDFGFWILDFGFWILDYFSVQSLPPWAQQIQNRQSKIDNPKSKIT
jgi:hypothetical protein